MQRMLFLPVVYFEAMEIGCEAANSISVLCRGHMIHTVMVMRDHLHNKRQNRVVSNCKQFFMETDKTQNSFLSAALQPN